MTTDRELLEKVAKAVGLTDAKFQDMEGWGEERYGYSCAIWSQQLFDRDGSGYWNPLADDGDAFRLAVKLGLFFSPELGHFLEMERFAHQDQEDAFAHRRAIVRAAAALGAAT